MDTSFDWRVQILIFFVNSDNDVVYSKLETSWGSGACDEEADGGRQLR